MGNSKTPSTSTSPSPQEHEAAADVTDEELAAMGRLFTKFVPPGHFWPRLVAEIKRRRAEAIDADHEWAQWFEKWRATLDTFSSLRMMDAAALADAVREARKIAGCVSCEDHAALICNPCAAKGKADAVRVARVECDMDWCHFLALEEDAKRGPDLLSCTLSIPCTNPLHNIGEGDATPGPEPDPALLDALRSSLRWATPPKKGTGR